MTSIKTLFNKAKRRIVRASAKPSLYIKYYNDGIIHENTILFEAFSGQSFQGSCYQIFKELFCDSKYHNFTFYISALDCKGIKRQLLNRRLYDHRVKIIAIGSPAYIKAICHVKYLVNNVGFNSNFIIKDNQVYIHTWHGMGPKCCGRRVEKTPKAFLLPQRNFLLSDGIICVNKHTERAFLEDHMIGKFCSSKLLYHGYPSNTPFFNKELQEEIREQYALQSKKTVVYLPTWRGRERLQDDIKAIESIDDIAEELQETHVFYYKLHPNLISFNIQLKHCRPIPDTYELYEFISCMDYFITDWSSAYADFAIKSSRIILFQYDRKYMLSDRGLYLDYVDNTPFPVAENISDVKKLLKTQFTVEHYQQFKELYCPYDSPNNTIEAINALFGAIEHRQLHTTVVYIDRIIDSDIIKRIQAFIKEPFVYIIPDNLPDSYFEYYNKMPDFDYLTILVEHTLTKYEKKAIEMKCDEDTIDRIVQREIVRNWGRELKIQRIYKFKESQLPFVFDALKVEKIDLDF